MIWCSRHRHMASGGSSWMSSVRGSWPLSTFSDARKQEPPQLPIFHPKITRVLSEQCIYRPYTEENHQHRATYVPLIAPFCRNGGYHLLKIRESFSSLFAPLRHSSQLRLELRNFTAPAQSLSDGWTYLCGFDVFYTLKIPLVSPFYVLSASRTDGVAVNRSRMVYKNSLLATGDYCVAVVRSRPPRLALMRRQSIFGPNRCWNFRIIEKFSYVPFTRPLRRWEWPQSWCCQYCPSRPHAVVFSVRREDLLEVEVLAGPSLRDSWRIEGERCSHFERTIRWRHVFSTYRSLGQQDSKNAFPVHHNHYPRVT